MSNIVNLERVIKDRQLSIVRILLYLLLGIGLLAFIVISIIVILNGDLFSSIIIVVYFLLLLYILSAILFIIYLNNLNIQIVFIFVAFELFIPALFLILTRGTLYIHVYLLATLIVISDAFIFRKNQRFVFWIVTLIILIVLCIQNIGFIQYSPVVIYSDPINTVLSLCLLWIVKSISSIGFKQIEHSYVQAFEYATKLEYLNKNLDNLVLNRTEQLKKSLEDKEKALHRLIIIGRISKPIFHDILTPLTIIKSNIEILLSNSKYLKPKDYDRLNILLKAENQIEKILSNTSDLLTNSIDDSYFNANITISEVIQVLKSEFNDKKIVLKNELIGDCYLHGSSLAFERVIINLLINAIQALELSSFKKQIILRGIIDGEYIFIHIEDNGIGIPKSSIKNVFNEGFTTKTTSQHLGIGLDYVKQTIEQQFKGKIQIQSEENKYTRVILKFPKQ